MSTGDKVIALIVAVVLLAGVVAWLFHWYVLDYKYWRLPAWQGRIPARELVYDEYLYSPDDVVTTTGEIMTRDEWEQLDPDLAAETLTAEWHDEGNETTAITGQMNVLDDLRLLAWDASRQVSMIKTLRAAYRQEMAWTLDWYRDALEHRRVA